jgi:CxxC motif-containing protein (DUF1111 family)
MSQFTATASQRNALGIAGRPNRNENDGTITRFGWKAQNKSITVFAGEAYNVEMGITNELFPTAPEEDPACMGNDKPEPNDVTRTDTNDSINEAFTNPLHELPDWMMFQIMMRFIDAPQPDPNPSASAIRGNTVFSQIGCALCPYAADADRAGHGQRRPREPARQPVLGSAAAPDGPGTGGQHHPGVR